MLELLKQIAQIFNWWVIVSPWEQAIRVRFGKHVRKLEAGFYFRIPFFDHVFKQSVRRRLKMIRPQTLTTVDGHVVTCAAAIGFEITDLQKLYDTLESPNDTIENEAAAIIASYFGDRKLADCNSGSFAEYVMSKLELGKYGLGAQEFYPTSFAASKTYRFITGEMGSWSHDGQISMEPVK